MSVPRLGLGHLTIQRIVEQDAVAFDPLPFFPALTPAMLAEDLHWLQPRYFDPAGRLVLCIQSYVVRTRHHVILVDTCIGNNKPRPNRPHWHMMKGRLYEENLAKAGLGFGDVDFVMCTHLHVDHVGWNTRLEDGRWVPTFPRARYLFSGIEWAHWAERNGNDPSASPWITDSVLPIVEAGRAELVKSDHALDDEVRLIPTPGHTIDHFSVEVGIPGADAIITGDMIHSPLQARRPEIGMFLDYDTGQGTATRRRVLDRLCESPTLLCSAHFPSTPVGRIVRHGDGFDFHPVPNRS